MAGAFVTRRSGQSFWIGDIRLRVFLRGKRITFTIEREGGLPELRREEVVSLREEPRKC